MPGVNKTAVSRRLFHLALAPGCRLSFAHVTNSDLEEAPFSLEHGASGGSVELESAHARSTYRFSVVARRIYLFSATGHFLFVILFTLLRVPPLAIYNIASTLLFLLCLRLNRREWYRAAFAIAGVEVLVHSTLCALLVGWATGYHYFIIGIVPFAMLLPGVRIPAKLAISTLIFVAYGFVYFITARGTPPYVLDESVNVTLNFINLGVTFAAFSLLVHFLHTASIRAEATVQSLSRTDQLTGLLNRRGMEGHLEAARSALDRTGEPFSILLGDLDHFKAINDQHGHACGDRVLAETAAALSAPLRSRDVVCRWGGEEFLILLPGADEEGTQRVAEKLLDSVRAIDVPCGSSTLNVTITLGGATTRRRIDDNRLIAAADQAMYRGKTEGRDRYVGAAHT